MPTAVHQIDHHLLDKRVTVHLAGVGGNGAQMAACLARLDIAIRALGHPHGIFVHAFDPDVVTESNVGRQLYSPSDIGASKAIITITRLNHFYGLDWDASASSVEEFWNRRAHNRGRDGDILVSCVDSRIARRTIHDHVFAGGRYSYWVDLGNSGHDGQVILGEPPKTSRESPAATSSRLPCVTELYPELLHAAQPDANEPSCSVRLSLASQGLFVNDFAVRHAAQLLYELFSRGCLSHQGVIFNLDTKKCAPIPLNRACLNETMVPM